MGAKGYHSFAIDLVGRDIEMGRDPDPALPGRRNDTGLFQTTDDQLACHACFPETHDPGSGIRRTLAESLEAQRDYTIVYPVAERLKAQPQVWYAEPDYLVKADITPNDQLYNKLWGMPKIVANQAWDVTEGSKDVVVGVVDTGVDYTHPDLAANVWSNPGSINGCDCFSSVQTPSFD